LKNSLERSVVRTIAAHAARCYAAIMTGAREFSASRPTVNSPTGVIMKMSISYKHVQAHQPVEAEVAHRIAKLNRLLKSYEPDLVQLHGTFTQNPHKEEHSFSVNLALPTGSLHATGTAENPRGSCKQAFTELECQLKKHQSILRKDHQWKRKRPIARVAAE
jgi:ribosome-associated translation inhibitor RaiA